MSLEVRLSALAQAIGIDMKALIAARGDLTALTTTEKSNLVAAINEVYSKLNAVDLTDLIDDTKLTGANITWSVDRIAAALAQLKSEIIDGAPEAWNTLKEISDYIASDQTATTAILTALDNRVRFDAAQVLTAEQKVTACTNIGVGNPEVDLVAVYTTARG